MAHNTKQSEKAILGKILYEGDVKAAATIPPKLFSEKNKIVLLGMRELVNQNRKIELPVLCDILSEKDVLEEVGGESYLKGLVESGKSVKAIDGSLEVLEDAHRTQNVYNFLRDIVSGIEQKRYTGKEAINKMISCVNRLGEGDSLREGLVPAGNYLESVLEAVEKGEGGYETGFDALDDVIIGAEPHNVIVIGADTGIGKSSFARCMTYNMACKNIGVGYYTYEESGKQLTRGFLSLISGIPTNQIKGGYLSKEEWGEITETSKLLQSLPVYIDETPSLDMAELEYDIQKKADKIDVVFIDHLQEIVRDPSGWNGSKSDQIGYVVKTAKTIAKRYNLVVCLLSQFSRKREYGDTRAPRLSDLRGSGEIEESADIVMLIHELIPGVNNPQPDDRKTIKIEKNREAKPGTQIELGWNGPTRLFYNLKKEE